MFDHFFKADDPMEVDDEMEVPMAKSHGYG